MADKLMEAIQKSLKAEKIDDGVEEKEVEVTDMEYTVPQESVETDKDLADLLSSKGAMREKQEQMKLLLKEFRIIVKLFGESANEKVYALLAQADLLEQKIDS